MSYFGQTLSYLKKHFWLPVAAMILPAIAACFLSTPYWEVSFMTAFDYYPYQSAADTFRIMFGDSWQYLWPVILIAVLQVFGAALSMSAMDKHFRTGELSIRSPWRQINNTVFPIAIGVAVMSVLSIILRFILFGLVMLVQVCGSALSFPSGATLAVISVIAVGVFCVHVLIITPVLFWAPIMFIYGYKFLDAAASSFKLLSGKKVFRGLFLPMLICSGIQLLVGFLQAHVAVTIIVGFIVFLFTNVYTTVYTMVAFYGISGLERRDIAPYRAPLPVPPKKPEPQKPTVADGDLSSENAAQAESDDKKQPDKRKRKPDAAAEKPKPDKKSNKTQSKKRSTQKQPESANTLEPDVHADDTSAVDGEGGGDVV